MTPKAQLHNLVLDFVYKRVCQGKSNAEITKEMEKVAAILPTMSNDDLNKMREEFKLREQQFPEKMALFRKRLRV